MNYGLQRLKGLYSGHVTLVGNGPSLDVEKIEGYSFAMNSISLIFPHTAWRPDFYVCTSRELLQNKIVHKRIADVIVTGVPCFLNAGYGQFIGAHPNVYYFSLGYPNHEPTRGDWLQNGTWFVGWSTTMLCAAQMAQYLGFDDYTMVGVDGYKPHDYTEDPNHFDPSYNIGLVPEDRDTGPDAIEELNRRHKLVFEHIRRMFGRY